jgi:phosphate starvation-inducible protein PhoH and related proteins
VSQAAAYKTINLENSDLALSVSGPHSAVLRELSEQSRTQVSLRGTDVHILGDPDDVELAHRFLEQAVELAAQGNPLSVMDVAHSLRGLRHNPESSLADLLDRVILVGAGRRPIAPKTEAQAGYIESIRTHDLTFGIGPAGTGKTYLAMAMAAAALVKHQVKRIILTRPAVEAGERLGFLPGDLADKVNPYLRPLHDALGDMMDYEKIQQFRSRAQIEVAPLAFMRGRTLSDAFVILDEAQNATSDQMKMFLTRMGYGSKVVVTGDVTQTDLPRGARSGLEGARAILRNVPGVAFHHFTDVDVVRHPLVQRIVVAYERAEAQATLGERPSERPSERHGQTPAAGEVLERAPDTQPAPPGGTLRPESD